MAKQHYKPEQIISKLREAKVELGRGLSVPLVCKQLGITDSTYYRWRQESGCLRDSDTPVCRAGGPAVSAVRQRSGVPGRRRAGVVTAAGGAAALS